MTIPSSADVYVTMHKFVIITLLMKLLQDMSKGYFDMTADAVK